MWLARNRRPLSVSTQENNWEWKGAACHMSPRKVKTGARMNRSVVGSFGECQKFEPLRWFIVDKCLKVLFEYVIENLCLVVCLRVL